MAFDWLTNLRRLALGGACGAALVLAPGAATAGDDADVKALLDTQNRQIELQKQQIEELKRRLDAIGNPGATFTAQPTALQKDDKAERRSEQALDNDKVKSVVADYLKEQDKKKKDDDAKKKKEAEEKGYEVPQNNVGLSASWNSGLILQSENKDFRIHVGGRFNQDSLWWHQPRNLKAAAAPGGGAGLTPGLGVTNTLGLGAFDDGTFFRRVRIQMDGQAYEVMEFACETCFDALSPVFFDDMWVGVKEVPFVNMVRLGQTKVPQGLESYSSSRFLTFMERSALFDTFFAEFGTGVFLANHTADQRVTWQAQIAHRIEADVPASGAQFGDGDYAYTGRVTMLPVYEQNGRYLLHLGLSGQYRSAQLDTRTQLPGAAGGIASPVYPTSTPANLIPLPTGGNILRYRSRFELRDASGTTGIAGLGDNNRAIDTGNIICDGAWQTGAEVLGYWGPFWFQGEGIWARVIDAFYPAAPIGGPGTIGPGGLFNTNSVARGSPTFWGVYGSVGWFLTGENRGYDRRLGRYDRVIPNENFYCVRGEDCNYHHGLGAWEVLYRYSYVDLNSQGINGGLMGEHTLGLNWYLNPNFHIMFNALAAHRDVTNSTLVTPAPTLTPISGTVYGLGVRVHYDF
jgi:phosphate-selective porin OprO/OprP